MLGSKNFGQSFRWLADFFWPNETKNERNQTLHQKLFYPTSNRTHVADGGRELGCCHVRCCQGWQGVMSDGSVSNWVSQMVTNQSKKAMATAECQPVCRCREGEAAPP